MKPIRTFAAALLTFTLVHSAHAIFDPGAVLGLLREPITNRLSQVNNSPSPDRKLATALDKALTTLNKASATDLGLDVKLLSQIGTGLLRSSASNDVGAAVQVVVDSYTVVLAHDAMSASNQLLGAFPSGTLTSAERNLDQLYDYLDSLNSSTDLLASIKTLGKAVVKDKVIGSLVAKAVAVRPRGNSFSATVSASEEGTYVFKPFPAVSVQGAYDPVLHSMTITATSIKGTLTSQTRQVILIIQNVAEGTATYTIGAGAHAIYSSAKMKVTLRPPSSQTLFSELYNATAGTITITRNSSNKTVFGTFQFSGPGSINGSRHADITSGSLSVNYLP